VRFERIPLLCRGGEAAPLRKSREATKAAQTGWSLTHLAYERPPRPLHQRRRRDIFFLVASTPPLQGGEWLEQETST